MKVMFGYTWQPFLSTPVEVTSLGREFTYLCKEQVDSSTTGGIVFVIYLLQHQACSKWDSQ